MSVAVVTDSTSQLPDGFASRHGITVVPLYVLIDGEAGHDGTDVDAAALTDALSARRKVTTSMATPDELAKVYREVLDNGSDSVVSIHISSELSGTYGAAKRAAKEVGEDRVTVVDSRTTVMGLGFAAMHAAKAASEGSTAEEVAAAARGAVERSRTLFVVDTLEYLRRGGRIGTATALLGTALAMKPVLHIVDGKIKPLEKVRTTSRAMSRLVDLAVSSAGEGPVEIAVHHLAAPERASELANRLEDRLPNASGCVVSEIGAVIGAHAGPGALGVVVQRGEQQE